MGRVTFHPEVLEEGQTEVLAATGARLSERGFHLAGGTALALRFGHRTSIDFDWFTGEHLEDPLRLARELADEGVALEVRQVAKGTLHASVDGVQVSLLEYRYPLLDQPVPWEQRGISLLSLDDIACMKLSAITQRGSRKDFVDLYVLTTEHRPLSRLLDLYRKKYDVAEVGHVLYSLVYFEEAERERMPRMLRGIKWNEIRISIEDQVQAVAG